MILKLKEEVESIAFTITSIYLFSLIFFFNHKLKKLTIYFSIHF